MKSLVVVLACSGLYAQSARYDALNNLPIHELTNVELAEYLNLRTTFEPYQLDGLTDEHKSQFVANRVAEYAQKSVGTRCVKGKNDGGRSDELHNTSTVAFVNRCLAMASARDWQEYYTLLLHLNFKNGEYHLAAQNHFLLKDWPDTASWAVTEVTNSLGETVKLRHRYLYHNRKKALYEKGAVKKYRQDMQGIPLRYGMRGIPGTDQSACRAMRTGDIVLRAYPKTHWERRISAESGPS